MEDQQESEDEFDLKSEDLFYTGTTSSPRKEVPHQDATLTIDRDIVMDGQLSASVDMVQVPVSLVEMDHCSALITQSSPTINEKESEEGITEEFWMNSPPVLFSKSLALRRVTSDLLYSSPQFQEYLPVSAKQWLIIQTKKSGYINPGSTSVVARIPFGKMLKRQESELFENLSKGPMDLDTEQVKFKSSHMEFKIITCKRGSKVQEDIELCCGGQNLEPKDEVVAGNFKNQLGEQQIKIAVENLTHHGGDIIADGTEPYALPCFQEKKEELMFISADTLAKLMNGGFGGTVDQFEVIDCRYPYEYKGGHVIGALNMYKAESVEEIMSWKSTDEENGKIRKRMVLIFHCEFSSQRGPAMMRLLRNTDRKKNSHCYPSLCHPEIYLLNGGYKSFFESYPAYVPMIHHDYQHDLRMFRSKAVSWHGKDIRIKNSHSLII